MKTINLDTFNKKWHLQLLKLFPKAKYLIELTDWYTISFENILDSNINLSTKYGMFSLYFISKKSKEEFCALMEIKIVDKIKKDIKLVGTEWNGNKYKFRIYAHSHPLRIFFYPPDNFNVENIEEKINFYTESLETVLKTILDNKKEAS